MDADSRERLARLAAFPEQNPNPVIELDARSLVYANPAALTLFPELPESGDEHPLLSGARRVAAGLRETGARSGSGEVELDEACYHLDIYLVPETGGFRAYATDVTKRRESERRFRQLFDHCVEAIFLHDTRGRIVDCNAEACLSLGYGREELLSLSVEDFALDVLSQEERLRRDDTPWSRALRAGPEARVSFHENVHRRKDGSTFPVEVGIGAMDYGERRLVLASARDISERKLLEEELVHRATHDPLTGLPNRELLDARLETALARAGRRGEGVAVMFLHLGGLQRAREQLGYRAGDRLLAAAAQRIRGCLGLEDSVGRMSGDELVVLAESATDGAQSRQTTLDILEELRQPLQLADREFQTEATVGVSLAPAETGDPIDEAYEAMCQARRSGEPYAVFA